MSGLFTEQYNRRLELEIERLRIEITRIRQVYQNECSVFDRMVQGQKSLSKYGLVQRYIMAKFIVKIAAKSDV